MGTPTWSNGKVSGFRPAPTTGISDILGILPGGIFLAVECKVKKNKPTPNQLDFMRRVVKAGGVALVAYSLDDVIDLLKTVDRPKRSPRL